MNNRAFTISLALAGLAVFMVYSFITSKEEELKAKYGTEVAVIIAKKNIEDLAEIHENEIEVVSKPKKFIEPGRVSAKEEVVGFIASVPIRAGEQITLNKIIAPGVRTGLSRQVTPGKRGVAIPVSDDTAVSRLLKPGDRVDILATIDPPGQPRGNQISKIVLQDVSILAVGEYITTQVPRKVEKDETTGKDFVRKLNFERNFNTITVEVEPQAALQLSYLVSNKIPLIVLLRNNDDMERLAMPGVNATDVLGTDSSKGSRAVSGAAGGGAPR